MQEYKNDNTVHRILHLHVAYSGTLEQHMYALLIPPVISEHRARNNL